MQDAVIVSTARTPIAKAFRGAFNDLKSPSMAAVALRAAVERAGIEPGEIEDVVMGTAMQGGTASTNLARLSLLAAGLPLSVSGQTIDRQCASGLMAISIAAKQIMVDGMAVTVGAGLSTATPGEACRNFVRCAATRLWWSIVVTVPMR